MAAQSILEGRRQQSWKGSGRYGTVHLCNVLSKDGQSEECALKVQSPTESLAVEYKYLVLLNQRVKPDESGFLPFPCPLGHYMHDNGGMLLTSYIPDCCTLLHAAENLNDVCRVQMIDSKTRGLIATLFTARILTQVVVLHKNRVLVSNESYANVYCLIL